MRSGKPRFEASRADHHELVRKFAAAAYAGDEKTLLGLFSPDIAVVSDGGGRVTAARKVVRGIAKVIRLFTVALPAIRDHVTAEIIEINGEPGVVEYYDGQPFAATTFAIDDGKIGGLYRVMNPDKLKAFAR